MKTDVDPKGVEQLLDKTRRYLTPEKLAAVEDAYRFAAKAHGDQVRESGEPYMEHPIQVTLLLADLQLDSSCLSAALLHDVPEDTKVSLQEIEAKFGSEIAKLVDGVTKLGKIKLQAPGIKESTDEAKTRAENLRKMLLAMAQDIRVVLIKLADRLHNMRTLGALPPQRRLTIAQETMEIFAPLAHRLGIWELKWQLEDLAFRHLYPDKYREVVRLIATRRTEREEYIAKVIRILEEKLQEEGIHAQIKGRPKNIYSIYTKMQKYAAQGKEFSEIYDLLALRVLVDEVQDCYSALGVIHSLWHPLPGQFNDYIANPKQNMYQSLHTTVMSLDGRPLEVQVRTKEMHRIAEYGVAAHWRYKEGLTGDVNFEEKMAWLRQLVDWQRELSGGAEEFIESVKTDIFPDQVFVYTPKGEIKELPAGSTPLDFAYRIHTDLGHRCIGAKVKGKLVPLNYLLQNGDTVEIMTTKTGRGPSRDWLNPDLGYVNSTHAREKIRAWFKKQERTENIGRGRELLEKELRRLGIAMSDQPKIAQLFKHDNVDDFLAAIGCGDVNPRQIAVKLAQEEAPETISTTAQRPTTTSGIEIYGVGDLLTRIAQCCKPVPGDEIVGFVTRGRGVAVHRKDCPSVVNEDEKERLIKVEWSAANHLYPVDVIVDGWDRVGLLRDISAVVSGEKVNISSVSMLNQDGNTIRILLTLEVTGIGQLSQLMSKLELVRGITSVARSADRAKRGN
ncbi:MAG: bifunctional (p)ppGpp synthetase/guanosine-3',5'-bis(diphosphate) 3'-pyrophosphohydrolase [Dehalococcoidia bacterium]|nr:bifunctional (p)ppGpp synthetase/guanosine-3',5'-bis(diphosphate) 3'-pyrophosphohydrolase [Dehalococcoidia bacterium]